jgi:hypothetical protein
LIVVGTKKAQERNEYLVTSHKTEAKKYLLSLVLFEKILFYGIVIQDSVKV